MGRNSVIGELKYVTAAAQDTMVDIARRNDMGYDEMVGSNPTVNRWIPEPGSRVLVPSKFILPRISPGGIVINLAELRLFYFPYVGERSRLVVMTFPISVGRIDWNTPLGVTAVRSKEENPTWTPPSSIRAEHALEGDVLPPFIPGGRLDNPLGRFALKLLLPGYLIHGTDESKSFGIGMRVTHGCIRMYPEDIEKLFYIVDVGTKVTLMDEPVKVGWEGPDLYIEIHLPLPEDDEAVRPEITEQYVLERAQAAVAGADILIDSDAVSRALRVADGVPVRIGRTRSGLPPAAPEGTLPDEER